MRRVFAALVLMQVLTNFVFAQETEHLAKRKQLWQEYLEQNKFRFIKNERGMISSLEYFAANRQLQLRIIVNRPPKPFMSYEFGRDDETLVTVPGHIDSVFLTVDNKLYFTNFDSLNPGCTVSAYDLTNGEKLWRTDDISRLRQGGTSGYLNQVLLRWSRFNEVPGEPEKAALIITGHEGFGDYIAVLDRETGVLLAHKIYGTGFGPASRKRDIIDYWLILHGRAGAAQRKRQSQAET